MSAEKITSVEAISASQEVQLRQMVEDLTVQAEAEAVLVTDTGGNLLTSSSTLPDDELQTIAALGAGSFAATRELAVMTGEEGFQSVAHEGTRSGIYVRIVADAFLIIVIFEKTTTLGLVKLYAEKAACRLKEVLNAVASQTTASAAGNQVSFELKDGVAFFDR